MTAERRDPLEASRRILFDRLAAGRSRFAQEPLLDVAIELTVLALMVVHPTERGHVLYDAVREVELRSRRRCERPFCDEDRES